MAYKQTVLQNTRQITHPPYTSSVTDAQLIERFLSANDGAAFELLVRRHGGMVLSVCKRVLHDAHAAEDAFQATFLTLVRKAGAIGNREAVSSWLYKVAYRVALRLKDRTAQRRSREKPLDELVLEVCYKPNDELAWRELRAVLDAEVSRLPEKYRTVFVLCYLEGKTNEQAAELLGCPKGTVLSRLARARERLRARMAWRGQAFAACPFASLLTRQALTTTKLPSTLVHATLEAAARLAKGQGLESMVTVRALELMEGAVKDLSIGRRGLVAAVTAVVLLLLMGAGTLAYTTHAVPWGFGLPSGGPTAPSAAPVSVGCGSADGCAGP
jgi:RNA polymerase sigma factor (sigma-70 family)